VGQERGGGEAATVFRVAEAEIGESLRRQVQALLQACFDGYPGRSYFKLPPHFRYLAMKNGALAAQMGVELRVIRVGSTVVRTFGVVDLCVMASERSSGLAGRMLAEVTELARACGMDFVILFADDDRLYPERVGACREPLFLGEDPRAHHAGPGHSGRYRRLDGESDWAAGLARR
jgi:hypothetical protein